MLQLLESLGTQGLHKGKIWSVTWNPVNGMELASCGEDKGIVTWYSSNPVFRKATAQSEKSGDVQRTELTTETGARFEFEESLPWVAATRFAEEHHSRTVREVAWSPCGRLVAAASFDATISIWERKKGSLTDFELLTTVEGHENEVKSVAWSPSGDFFASCSRDKNVNVWSISAEQGYEVECESVLSAHSQDVKRICWHPTEDILVSASYDDTIKLYKHDPNDGDWVCTSTLEGHESTVWSVDFDATGERLVSVSDDRTIKIWGKIHGSKDSWSCLSTVQGYHDRPIYDVSWNKFNGLIATACGDNHVRIFRENPATGDADKYTFDMVCKVQGHTNDVNCVNWNPHSPTILASCCDDSTIKLWRWEEV